MRQEADGLSAFARRGEHNPQMPLVLTTRLVLDTIPSRLLVQVGA
jgi:hypothetical protein